MVRGLDAVELSTLIKDEARFFTFTVEKPDDTTSLLSGDEVVVLTHSRNLPDLRKRWGPKQADNEKGSRSR